MAPLSGAGIALLLTLLPVPSDTTTVEALVEEARSASPRILAARLRAEAAAERIAPAGALPDPMLSVGLMNRSLSDPLGSDIQMTMNQVQLQQRLPWPGRRSASRDAEAGSARAEEAEAREVEAAVVARVRALYHDVAYLDRAAATLSETRELVRAFREVAQSLYEVGDGVQADVLQAQIVVAEIRADLAVAEERRVAAVARLNGLLGRPPDAPIGPTRLLPPGDPLPSASVLMERAAGARPALAAAEARIDAVDAARRLAELNGRPDVTLTTAYAHRPDFPDLGSIAVGINLPLFGADKNEPRRREQEARLRALEADERELVHETFARLTELRAAAERARELARLYESSILPQADAAVEAALSAYRVGRVDAMTLLDAEAAVNRFRLERFRLWADHHTAVAQIDALLGDPNEETKP